MNDGGGNSGSADQPPDDDGAGDGVEENDEDDGSSSEEDEEDEAENEGDDLNAGGGGVNIVAPADHPAVPGDQAAVAQGNWLTYEEMMNETYPSKSKEIYLSAYRNFEIYLKSENQFVANVVPTETMMLNYFRYLYTIKGWAATSLWSQYSRLNGVLKRRFKFSLKLFPSVTDLIKSYEVGHLVKKASVFSPQQENIIICLS